jgi:hypothetical protein
MSEIDILNFFIKREFGTKKKFADAVGMTTQNLHHHIRQAGDNGDKFTYHFKATLWKNGLNVFKQNNPGLEFKSTETILRDEQAPFGGDVNALNKIIQMQDEKIKLLERELMELKNIKPNIRQKAS